MTDHCIWFEHPAGSDWNAALPIGNGRMGAMIFGNVADERIQLNEDTVWSGGARDRINPDAAAALPAIRQALTDGRLGEAEALAQRCLNGIPDSQLMYQPLADLWLNIAHPGRPIARPAEETLVRLGLRPPIESPAVTDYRRELDLSTGEVRVAYRLDGVGYERTHLASNPHGAIMVRLASDRAASVSFSTRLTRGTCTNYAARYLDSVQQVDGDALLGSGRSGGKEGHALAVCVRCHTRGGRVRLLGETLVVEGADEAWLAIVGATSFRHADPSGVTLAATKVALVAGWLEVRRRHVADHAELFSRTTLVLDGEAPNLPTDERVARLRAGSEDPDLLRLFFDYGRYLLIASSRPGSLPATLQGRWCQEMEPPWGAKYTININTQMNYWPAEPCGLGECHEALFDLIDRLRDTGEEVARRMYGCRGFVVHHNTDLVADACPTDRNLAASYWPMGGAWLSLHLWERWLFSGARPDLERAWPALRDASRFFLDFLVPDRDGALVVSPSCSPEHAYRLGDGSVGMLCAGASMDNQIVERLFAASEECARRIGFEPELARKISEARRRIPPPRIGSRGQLLEWAGDHEGIEPGHRHVSHLFALHPGGAIDPIATPELAAAARLALEERLAAGGAGTGWSRAWTINFFCRLLDGDAAHSHLRHLVAHSTLPNLFDDHPPFQIDGNFGACAGIVEMLVQSHRRDAEGRHEVHLLPALPKAWPAGSLRGARVRGGGRVDIEWRSGKGVSAALHAATGSEWRIRFGDTVRLATVPEMGSLSLIS